MVVVVVVVVVVAVVDDAVKGEGPSPKVVQKFGCKNRLLFINFILVVVAVVAVAVRPAALYVPVPSFGHGVPWPRLILDRRFRPFEG